MIESLNLALKRQNLTAKIEPDGKLHIKRDEGVKCERCRSIGDFSPKTQLCIRCISALISWAEETGLAEEVAQAVRDKTSLANRKLYGVILANADLRGMDFSGATMPVDCFRSDFRGCNLQGADFSRSLTTQSVFDKNWSDAIKRIDQNEP